MQESRGLFLRNYDSLTGLVLRKLQQVRGEGEKVLDFSGRKKFQYQ